MSGGADAPSRVAQSRDVSAAVSLEQLEGDPHAALAELRAREPVAWVDGLGGWLVTSRELALEVMRDSDRFTVDDPRFTTARVVGPSMLSLDGAAHTRHREPWVPGFRRADVHERLGEVVAAETDRLIDGFAADGRGDLRGLLAGPLAAAVVGHALELKADSATVLGWYRAIVDSVQAMTAGGEPTAAGRDAFAELAAALETDAASDAAVILFGGIETTEGMIATALWFLLGHPGGAERALAEPAWLEGAIEESLRLEPAAAMVDRYATADTELGGAPCARATWWPSRSPPPTATRPRSPTPTGSTRCARTRAAIWRSRPGRTCASECTWHGWRRTPRCGACWSACPGWS